MNLRILLILVMAMAMPDILFARQTVTGVVTNASDNQPLPGVSIVVKGTTQGTVSDVEGKYSINATSTDVLVFSFIGYLTKEVPVGTQTIIDVVLGEDLETLQEVVVVGYSTARKQDLTGAVAVVELEPLRATSTGSPMQTLQGRVPGLYIESTGTPSGESSRILIRGANSLGNNDPLYIIDGVPTKRPQVFQSLNPGTIESIQLLKDASSASIYGSRASNGVVIVTTKNGRNTEGKIRLDLNSSVSSQSEKSQRFKMLNAADRGRALWQASVNDRVDPASGYGEIYEFDWNQDFENPVLNNITVKPFVGGDTNVPAGDTDWQDVLYKTGWVTNNDITLSAGSEISSLLLSFGHVNNTGMMKYTGYNRYSGRINAMTSLFNNRLKFGVNSQMATSNQQLPARDLGTAPTPGLAITLAPTIPVYTSTGEFAGPLGSGYSDRNNPLHMQYLNRWDNTNRTMLFGNVYTEVGILKNLIFRSSLGMDNSGYFAKDIEQSFTEGFIARSLNNMTITTSKFLSLTWSNTLRLNFDLGSSNFKLLAGVESISDNFDEVVAYKENFATQTEDFFVLSAGSGAGNSFGRSSASRLFSQFARVDYNLSDKYLAALTLRRDGSSRFGEENRFGFFPAASIGWRISEEGFMQGIKNIIDDLKLRAGVGRVGNQDIGDFASRGLYEPRYGPRASQVYSGSQGHNGFFDQFWNVGTAYDLGGVNSGTLPSGFVSIQGANPSLKWETTEEVNVGVDFSFLNGKLAGAFDYFARETSDILIQPPVASAVGEGQLRFVNGATKTNRGWEFSLGHQGRSGDLTYGISTNLFRFRDVITVLPEEVRSAYAGNAEQNIVGHSQFDLFGFRTDGIFQNTEEVDAHANQVGAAPGRIRYKDLNNDGEINDLDQEFFGTTLPKLNYGVRLELGYKGLDFSVFGFGVAGRTGFDAYTFYNDFIRGRDNVGPGVFNAWTRQNPNSNVPALTLADANAETRPSDYFNVNTSFFKIRNMQLGYNLPTNLISKAGGMTRLRVYLMAENLFWIKSKSFQGPDPERVDINTIPVPRVFTLGLNLSL